MSAAQAARNVAIDTLDYIHAMRPDTDQSVITQLEKIIFLLRDGAQ